MCIFLLTGCMKMEGASPKTPASPDGAGASSVEGIEHWPEGRSLHYKVTDDLILTIPAQYERSAIYAGLGIPTPARGSVVIKHAQAQFDFFLPNFTGYTPQNYEALTNPNKVEVAYLIAADPEAQTPNMLKNALKNLLDPNDYQDMYGLRCYQARILKDRIWCYGRRDDSNQEDIMLYVMQPPYTPGMVFPWMHARYISKRFGGVEIAWRTHVSNFPRSPARARRVPPRRHAMLPCARGARTFANNTDLQARRP